MAAIDVIDSSLASGTLKTIEARRDGKLVRQVLDRAFRLPAHLSKLLTDVFGDDGSKKFGDGSAHPSGVIVAPANDPILLPRRNGTTERVTLTDALGKIRQNTPIDNVETTPREGEWAWNQVTYRPRTDAGRREYFRRIQKALHAGVPVPIGWVVADKNAWPAGRYPKLTGVVDVPTGRLVETGGHQTLIVDYEIDDVPGFGRLHAGRTASAEAKEAALAESAKIVFLRVKNSWGRRPGTASEEEEREPGYYDLTWDYLTGKIIDYCPDGRDAPCTKETGLIDVALPAGF
jgi:hypothetical protein